MGGFYITENFKFYNFVVGPQSFDEELFSYELRIGFRGTHMVLPGSYHDKQGSISIKDVQRDGEDISDIKKLAKGQITELTLTESTYTISSDFTDIVIPLTKNTIKVSFQAKSKYGIDMAHIYLVLKTKILEGKNTDEKKKFSQDQKTKYTTSAQKKSSVLYKLENASTIFDLNNIDKFNFGVIYLTNYFINVISNRVGDGITGYNTKSYEELSADTKAKKKIKALQCDANNILTINDSPVIAYEEVADSLKIDKCINYRKEFEGTLTPDDWFIFSRYGSNPALYKFDKDRFVSLSLNIKFNINYFTQILGRNINSIIPHFELHIHLAENENKILTDEELATEAAITALGDVVSNHQRDLSEKQKEEEARLKAVVDSKIENVDKLFVYNELDGEYDKLMSKKDKILQQDKEHELILRSSKNIQKKIGFYNQQIKRLKIVTLIVHIILAVIIIVALVYQNIGKFS